VSLQRPFLIIRVNWKFWRRLFTRDIRKALRSTMRSNKWRVRSRERILRSFLVKKTSKVLELTMKLLREKLSTYSKISSTTRMWKRSNRPLFTLSRMKSEWRRKRSMSSQPESLLWTRSSELSKIEPHTLTHRSIPRLFKSKKYYKKLRIFKERFQLYTLQSIQSMLRSLQSREIMTEHWNFKRTFWRPRTRSW